MKTTKLVAYKARVDADKCKTGKRCGDICISPRYICKSNSGKISQESPHLSKAKAQGRKVLSKVEQVANTKVTIGSIVVGSIASAIATGVISSSLRDINNYRQFKDDKKFWQDTGIPENLKKAYPHESGLATSLIAAEHKIQGKDYETAYVLDKTGKPLVIKVGNAGAVNFNPLDINKVRKNSKSGGLVLTHNHPSGGATLSFADLNTSGVFGLREVRATSDSEIYSLRLKDGVDPKEFKKIAKDWDANAQKILEKHRKTVRKEKTNNLSGILYTGFTKEGQSEFVYAFARKAESDLHNELNRIVSTEKYSNKFEYTRTPRFNAPNRENKFDSSYIRLVLSNLYTDEIEFANFSLNNKSIEGKFVSHGEIYDYSISPDNILTYNEHNDSASYLIGFSLDSNLALRADANIAKKRKCVQGKPCGNSCVAKGVKCQAKLSPQAVIAVNQVRKNLGSFLKQGEDTQASQKTAVKKNQVATAALIATPVVALAAGGAYLANSSEANKQAIASLYQNTLNNSGVRVVYPMTVNTIEQVIGNKDKDSESTAKSLAATILMADSEIKAKVQPKQGTAGAKERLQYINKLAADPLRAEEFKYSLDLFSQQKKVLPYPEEVAAIRYYTDTVGYKEINMTLRGQGKELKQWLGTQTWRPGDNRSEKQIKLDAEADIRMLNSGLNQLPDFKGKVYRGLTLPESLVSSALEPGKKWKETGFTSTTKNPMTRYPGNVAMVIKSKTGKDISKYEKFNNKEVLFKNNSTFTVNEKRKIKRFGQKFWLVTMTED
jgi:DNA repair protein RadC